MKKGRRDIWKMPFENNRGVQGGRYVVTANSLTEDGEVTGGGIVATFNWRMDAVQCYTAIRQVDTRHNPKIHENKED